MLVYLRQWAISTRLGFILAAALISLAVVGGLALLQERQALLDEKRHQLSLLHELAQHTLESYHQQVLSGQLTEARAQALALEQIRQWRFTTGQDQDYFWILDRQGLMLMHPEQPELEGRNVRQVRDPQDQPFIAELLDRSRQEPLGMVRYVWDKPGFSAPVGKMSVFTSFETWGWVLVNGIYLDTLNAQLRRHSFNLIGLFILAAVLLAGLVFAVIRSVIQPLKQMLARMREIADGDGDLTHRLSEAGQDELMHINRAFNRFITQIHDLVQASRQSALAVSAAAEELSAVTHQSQQTVDQQSQETDQVATAMNQMSATVQEVARHAQQAAEAARAANHKTQQGHERLNLTLNTLGQLDSSIQSTALSMTRLKEGTENIGSIMEVIRNVAEQTNLLALNAAIEAARAGEHGRGFAVVADEVRNLAARTQASTEEIHSMIERLVAEAEASFQAMQESQQQASHTLEHAQQTTQALEDVRHHIHQMADMNTQIASAAEQQAAVADEMSHNLVNINDLAGQTREGAVHTTAASHELAQLAEQLEQQVSQFKTQQAG